MPMKISLSDHKYHSKKTGTFLCGAALLAAASGAHGAILVDDNFTNSSGSSVNMENTQAIGVGTYERVQGSGNLTATTISGFGSGNVLQLGNNANTYFRAFNGDATLKLSNLTPGQTLSLSFDFRSTGDFGTNALNFGFGFLNATNSIAYVNLNAQADSPGSEFRFRTGSPNMTSSGTQIGTGWSNVTSPATNYNFELIITRMEADYSLQYFVDGAEISSATSALGATSDLDITGIGFRWGEGPGTSTNIDNVIVEVIPEPSSLLLLGGSLSCGLLLRRRKRQ